MPRYIKPWLCVRVALFIFVAFIISGCRGPIEDPSRLPNAGGLSSEVTISIKKFALDDYRVELRSLSGTDKVLLSVSFKRAFDTNSINNPAFDWGKAWTAGSHEMQLLILYANDQALRYAEGDKLAENWNVKCIRGGEMLSRTNETKGRWFFVEKERIEYCEETLALRQGTNMISLVPGPQPIRETWIELNRESYDFWWNQINERLKLSDMFQ